MIKTMNQAQEFLADYLFSLKITAATVMYILGILWEEEATIKMLEYIAENHPLDQAQLLSTALKISKE